MSEQITCGCTCHEIDADDPNNVILEGKKWNCICALKESVRLLGKTREELDKVYIEVARLRVVDKNYQILKDNVEELICPNCLKKVGDQWAFAEGGVCCTNCLSELFPHYF
jgi:hypothetical protein